MPAHSHLPARDHAAAPARTTQAARAEPSAAAPPDAASGGAALRTGHGSDALGPRLARAVQERGRPHAVAMPGLDLPRTGGDPLPDAVRTQMETAFESDFSAVSIHPLDQAAAPGARALTHGESIHIERPAMDFARRASRDLLGEELAHVVQQRSGRVRGIPGATALNVDVALEAEARADGARAARGEAVARKAPQPGAPLGADVIQGNWLWSWTLGWFFADSSVKTVTIHTGQTASETAQEPLAEELAEGTTEPTTSANGNDGGQTDEQALVEEIVEEIADTADELAEQPDPPSEVVALVEPVVDLVALAREAEAAAARLLSQRIAYRAMLSGADVGPPTRALQRLERSLAHLKRQCEKHNLNPHAAHAVDEFNAFEAAVDALEKLAPEMKALMSNPEAFLTLSLRTVHGPVNAALAAEKALRETLEHVSAQMAALAHKPAPKKATGVVPTTPAKRAGGTEGTWDPGYTQDQIEEWLHAKVKRVLSDKNVTDCAAVIVNHTKTSGGGTGSKFDGESVFHVSHGFMGSDDGCTVFFTKPPDGTLEIVGVGSHTTGGTAVYKLDWRRAGWTSSKFNDSQTQIDLSKK